VAGDPSGEFHFHRGPRYAADMLGYDAGVLAQLPDAGALPEAELLQVLPAVEFRSIAITHRFEPFRGTSKERVARKYGVIGVNVHAWSAERRGGFDMAACCSTFEDAANSNSQRIRFARTCILGPPSNVRFAAQGSRSRAGARRGCGRPMYTFVTEVNRKE
jgi:hypothetical protein